MKRHHKNIASTKPEHVSTDTHNENVTLYSLSWGFTQWNLRPELNGRCDAKFVEQTHGLTLFLSLRNLLPCESQSMDREDVLDDTLITASRPVIRHSYTHIMGLEDDRGLGRNSCLD